jgi:hypothetical protein
MEEGRESMPKLDVVYVPTILQSSSRHPFLECEGTDRPKTTKILTDRSTFEPKANDTPNVYSHQPPDLISLQKPQQVICLLADRIWSFFPLDARNGTACCRTDRASQFQRVKNKQTLN